MPPIGVLGELPLLPEALGRLQELAGGPLRPADHATSIVLLDTVTPLTAADLDRLPGLRHVALCGTSMGRIDTDELTRRGITLSRVVDYGDAPAAEVIVMQLVALLRGFGPYRWRAEPHELAGRSLLIVGLGALGGAVAHLGLAYGARVSHLSRSAKPSWEARGVVRAERDGAMGQADIVVLCGPTDVTVLHAEDFARLDGAIIVQASGGRVMEEAAFEAWIARDGNHAIFDLTAGEELFERYARLPRVIFPHVVAGFSTETRVRLGERVLANVTTALAGG